MNEVQKPAGRSSERAGSPAQAPPDTQGVHLVLYDGVCGLCQRLVQFLLEHDRAAVFTFAALQSPIGRVIVERFGGDPNDLVSFYVVADYQSGRAQMFSRSSAVLFIAGQLGWPWKAACLLRVLPTAIREYLYNVIARNRYRMFGRHEECLIPRPEHRRRFVE